MRIFTAPEALAPLRLWAPKHSRHLVNIACYQAPGLPETKGKGPRAEPVEGNGAQPQTLLASLMPSLSQYVHH